MIKAGSSIISITVSIRGISTTSAAFIPKISLSAGTLNGDKAIESPETRTRLNRFAPIIFPRERRPCPLISDVIAVTNSGKEVPSATNVSAITDSGTPRPCAIIVPLSTSRLAPVAISTAPTTSEIIFLPKGFSSSSPSLARSESLFLIDSASFICREI